MKKLLIMSINYLTLFLQAALGSVIALIGGVIFLYNKKLSKLLETYSTPFAAGVLITVALLGLLPESIESAGEVGFLIVLISFFGSYLFENVLFDIHHHNTDHEGHEHDSSVALVIVGDTIHNIIDGVAIGAGFLINPNLGLITALSTFLHEVPHEIGDFGILLKAGWKKRKIFLINLFSASTTIIGAFVVLLFAGNDQIVGSLMAVASGIFLYLGASDFLPSVRVEKNKLKSVLPLLVGAIVMAATLIIVPHGHDENDEGTKEAGVAQAIESVNDAFQ